MPGCEKNPNKKPAHIRQVKGPLRRFDELLMILGTCLQLRNRRWHLGPVLNGGCRGECLL